MLEAYRAGGDKLEWLTAVWEFVGANWDQLFQVVGVFAVIASMTPSKADDRVVQAVLSGIDFLGANFFQAKNSDK